MTAAFGTAGTNLAGSMSTMNVDVPDSVAADDIVIVVAFIDCFSADVTITGLASGFAQAPDSPVVVNPAALGTNVSNRLYIMWKRATGAEDTGGTYAFTMSTTAYINATAFRYTGANTTGDPWDVTNSAQSDDNQDTTTEPVSDTTTVADTMLVFTGCSWNGGTWTPPTSFTERIESSDGLFTVADLAQASPGATGSIVATCSQSQRNGGWVGALEPVAAGPTLVPRVVIVAG